MCSSTESKGGRSEIAGQIHSGKTPDERVLSLESGNDACVSLQEITHCFLHVLFSACAISLSRLLFHWLFFFILPQYCFEKPRYCISYFQFSRWTKEKSRTSCRDSEKHGFLHLVKNQNHLLSARICKLLRCMQLQKEEKSEINEWHWVAKNLMYFARESPLLSGAQSVLHSRHNQIPYVMGRNLVTQHS